MGNPHVVMIILLTRDKQWVHFNVMIILSTRDEEMADQMF